MATYTANYGLHQWAPGDNFLRTDFNTDFQKIDAGIKAALSNRPGQGGNRYRHLHRGRTQNRLINLGFQPRGVLVETSWGARGRRYPGPGGYGGSRRPPGPTRRPAVPLHDLRRFPGGSGQYRRADQ